MATTVSTSEPLGEQKWCLRPVVMLGLAPPQTPAPMGGGRHRHPSQGPGLGVAPTCLRGPGHRCSPSLPHVGWCLATQGQSGLPAGLSPQPAFPHAAVSSGLHRLALQPRPPASPTFCLQGHVEGGLGPGREGPGTGAPRQSPGTTMLAWASACRPLGPSPRPRRPGGCILTAVPQPPRPP